MALANETTGHTHTGAENKGPKITLTTGASQGVTGTLPIANGGTGQTTLAGLMNLVYPVGSYYFNDSDSTNPGTLLGVGTWVAVEERVLVGYKSGSTEFGTAGGEYGNKTNSYTSGTGSATATIQAGTGETGPSVLHTHAVSNVSTLQPSRTVYIWRRTV